MAEELFPIQIDCDAPPYPIVEGTRLIGCTSPEDVRWFRYSRFTSGAYEGQEIINLRKWTSLLGLSAAAPQVLNCTCGQKLPRLERFTFTLSDESTVDYHIAQCERCHTIFWDEVAADEG
jgi:hypothetical protein